MRRYLIRLSHRGEHLPQDQARLLAELRRRKCAEEGSITNLRVTSRALEFDLFLPPGVEPQRCLEAWRPVGEALTVRRLDEPPPATLDPAAVVAEARHLWNEQRFWEVHEVLEDLWKRSQGAEKRWIQGLIMAAAALVHWQKDEGVTGPALMAEALARLKEAPATYHGWNLQQFRDWLSADSAASAGHFPSV